MKKPTFPNKVISIPALLAACLLFLLYAGSLNVLYAQQKQKTGEWNAATTLPRNAATGSSITYGNGVYWYSALSGTNCYLYRFTASTGWATLVNFSASAGDGSAIAYLDSNGFLYMTRGNVQNTFYKYNQYTDTWSTDATTVSANVGAGGDMVSNGTTLYVLCGNTTNNFTSFNGTSWTPLNTAPANVAAGGSLVYVASQNAIYAFQGNGTSAFWRFSIASGTWNGTDPADLPGGKIPGAGASLAYPGYGDYIYAVLGGTTGDFYRYSIIGDSWTQLASLPASDTVVAGGSLAGDSSSDFLFLTRGGTNVDYYYCISENKWKLADVATAAIGNGSDMVYKPGTDNIYASRGSGTNEFRTYTISTDTWVSSTLPGAVNYGGAMVYCSLNNAIYVTAGNSTSFYRYNIGSSTWDSQPTIAALPGVTGYGADLIYTGGNYIYILRGGYYSTFWRYSIPDNNFSVMSSLPDLAYTGAALCYTGSGDYIYAFRGNSTAEFWRYSILSNSWTRMADTPANPAADADMSYPGTGDYIYAVRGSNNQGFWRYSLSKNAWEVLGNAPMTISTGSAMAYAGDYIYTSRGNNTATLWRYRVFGTDTTPTVSTITPNVGSVLGGNNVTITGSGFSPSSTVLVGGNPATNVVIVDGAKLTCTVPAGGAGAANVVVRNPGPLDGTLVSGFQYLDRPIISDFSPREGSPNGGTTLTITGFNFQAGVGAGVTIDGNACTDFTVVDSNTITCKTPAGTVFGGTVVVTNPDAQTDSRKYLYRYTVPNTWNEPAGARQPVGGGSETAFVPKEIPGAGKDYLYMLNGSNTAYFYRYSIVDNTWEQRQDAPATVTTGGTLCYPGTGDTIYALRGNNTTTFWEYSISGNSWSTPAFQPAVTFTSSDSAMTYHAGNNCLYVLRSGNTTDFLKYTIGVGWSSLQALPAAAGAGCDIIYTGSGDYVYAMRGNSTKEFWRYSIIGNSWLYFPSLDQTVTSGGSLAYPGSGDYIYAAFNPRYFRRFSISRSVWDTTLTALPCSINSGGDLVTAGGTWLYYMEGNGENNLSRYSLDESRWMQNGDITTPSSIYSGAQICYVPGSDYIYVIPCNTSLFFRYTISTRTVTSLTNLPSNPGNGTCLIYPGSGNYLYCLRGGGTVDFYRYSISDNTWMSLAGVPFTVSDSGSITYVPTGNSIYCIGNSTSFYCYSIDSNSWTQKANLLNTSVWLGAEIIYPPTGGDYIYHIRSGNVGDFYRYSLSNNIWAQLTSVPSTVFYGGSLSADNNSAYLYCMPGYNRKDFYKYDISGNSWKTLTDVPFNVYYGGAMTMVSDCIYIFSGDGDTTNGSSLFTKYQLYSPNTNPSVTQFSPASGPVSGGMIVAAVGNYFYPGVTVTVGGTPATGVTFVDAGTVKFTIPAGTTGAKDVVITNPGGYSTTVPGGFTYYDDPVIQSITPSGGTASGGFSVTINGYNFQSGATVTIGGVSATGVIVIDGSTINCTVPAGISYAADVYVENLDNKNSTLKYAFRYEQENTWIELAPAPATSLNGGSDMCYVGDNIYAFYGNGSQSFWAYNMRTNVWDTTRANAPAGVYEGGTLLYPGATGIENYIYATRGYNSSTFMRYSISGNSWDDAVLADPPGALVYWGGSMTYYYDSGALKKYIFLIKGNSTKEFYRYDIDANSWTQMANITDNVSTGGFLLYPGYGGYMYALIGNSTNKFYRYVISSNSWESLASTPYSSVNGGASLTASNDPNYIYATLGNGTREIYRYSIADNVWTTMASAPATLSAGANGLYIPGSDYIYILRSSNTSDFFRYKISDSSFGVVATTPYDIYTGGDLVYPGTGSYIYALIGSSQYFYKYDFGNNIWTQLTNLANTVSNGGSLAADSAGNYIYCFRGNNSTDFYRYSIAGNTWVAMAAAPDTVNDGGALCYPGGVGDYIYASRGNSTSSFWRYSIASNTWSTLSGTPATISLGGDISYPGTGDYIYLTRGAGTSEFYRYSISLNTWDTMTAAPQGFYYGTSLLYPGFGDYIYVLRGYGSNTFFKYSINANSWSTLTSSPYLQSYGASMAYPGTGDYLFAFSGNQNRFFTKYRLFSSGTPVFNAVIPSSGPVSGGYEVSIIGQNFKPGATVKFGSTFSSSVTFIAANKIKAVVPSGSAGAVDVVITNPDSSAATGTNAFTYDNSVIVSSVTPAKGTATSQVTITGYNFQADATVTIGGTTATGVTVVNSTTITAIVPTGTNFGAGVTVTNTDAQSGTLISGFMYDEINRWSEPRKLIGATTVYNDGDLVYDSSTNSIFAIKSNSVLEFLNYDIVTDTWVQKSVAGITAFQTGSALCRSKDNLGNPCIYAFKGGTTTTFYRFNIQAGDWTVMQSLTAGNNVSDGGDLFYPGTGDYVYAIQGTSTVKFWRYTISTNTWDDAVVADLPSTVTWGGALCGDYNPDNIYCIRGGGTSDFYRYSITNNNWTLISSAPLPGAANDDADLISSDDGLSIYYFRGSGDTSFYRYSVLDNMWATLAMLPQAMYYGNSMTNVPGSKYIYALIGNSSNSFVRYDKQKNIWSAYKYSPTVVNSGGSAAYVKNSNALYVLAGNNTSTFMKYSIAGDNWVYLTSTPATISDGGNILYPGSGDSLYALRGNNSNIFYRYSMSQNTWTTLSSAPGNVGTGAAMAYTGGDYVYVLQGNNSSDFWRYSIAGNSWALLTITLGNVSGGGSLCYPGSGNFIYAFQGGGQTAFWRYSIAGDVWEGTPTITVSPVGISDGGSLSYPGSGDYIYATRGSNTDNFLRYSILGNSWDNLSSTQAIPAITGAGSRLVYDDGNYFYLLKGMGYNALWSYRIWNSPVITSITPNVGYTAGGTNVTINGTNFTSGATVTFAGASATNVTFVDATRITCTTPAGGAGYATVIVTIPGPQTAAYTNGFTYSADPTPALTSINPAADDVSGGASLTFTGTDFKSGCTAYIGTTLISTLVFVNSTTLTAVAPSMAAGTYDVKVVNPDTQYSILTNGFIYASEPTVVSIAPDSGISDGGDPVTITGTNFVAGATVKIGANNATGVTVVNSTTITCTTPGGAIGDANVVVINPSTLSGTLFNGFTFQPAAMPDIISIAPDNGPVEGNTPCTITGTDFKSGATVFFGSNAALLVTWVDSTTITCASPAGNIGSVYVKVVNPDTQSDLLFNGFTYNAPPAPQITSITPDNGLVTGGTACTISGSNFNAGVTVFFGADPAADVVRVDSNTITCSSPAGDVGAVSIKVVNTDTQYDILFNGYTYNTMPAPQITSITPDNGLAAGGTSCTISGSNFNAGVAVLFGANPAASVVLVDSATITCTSPSGNAGTVTIRVTNTDTQYGLLVNGFTYTSAPSPQITTVSPSNGSIGGGTQLTISGSNFVNGLTVKIGPNNALSTTVVDSGTITCLTPAVATASTVNVTVTNPDLQSVTMVAGFSYDLPTGPVITGISPNSGGANGGTNITINGYNFQNGLTVAVGGKPATNVIFISSSSITAVTPSGTLGQVSVALSNPDGQSYTYINGFTYVAPPTITAVTPNSGSVAGNTFFTITGTNFQSGAVITIGGNAAVNVTFVNSTALTGYTPSGYTGKADVTITNPSQTNVTLTDGFEYTGVLPVANAGMDQTSDPAVITLDGSKSTNTAGAKNSITFQWTQVSGPVITLSSQVVSAPYFTGVTAGEYVFQLIVKEAELSSAPDSVSVKINNVKPVAVITDEEIQVTSGDIATLDGSGSYDANDDALTYNWTYHPALGNITQSQPLFDTIGLSGIFKFSLVVSDGVNVSSIADVTVIVNDVNVSPLACAGPDQSVSAGDTVYLDGSTSRDPDGSIKIYSWQYLNGPEYPLTLNGSDTATAWFTANKSGVYAFSLDVTDDNNVNGLTSYTSVYVNGVNHIPTASISSSGTKYVIGQTVTLYSSGSSDPDGDTLSYKWELLPYSGAMYGTEAGTEPTLSVTPVETGTFIYRLNVNDGSTWGIPDEMTIYVNPQGETEFLSADAYVSPDSDPDADGIVNMFETSVVTLVGSAEGGETPFSYLWAQTSGIPVVMDDTAGMMPSFAPRTRGIYEFRLTITDSNGIEAYANLVLIVNDYDTVQNPQGNSLPVSDAGVPETVNTGTLVTLDGSNSYDFSADADGVTDYASGLEFNWVQVDGPVVEIYDADTPYPFFTPAKNGTYKFKLTVNDKVDYSAESFVVVAVSDKINYGIPDDNSTIVEPPQTPDTLLPVSNATEDSGKTQGCFIARSALHGNEPSYYIYMQILLLLALITLFSGKITAKR